MNRLLGGYDTVMCRPTYHTKNIKSSEPDSPTHSLPIADCILVYPVYPCDKSIYIFLSNCEAQLQWVSRCEIAMKHHLL